MRVRTHFTLIAAIVACIGAREVLAQPCQEVVLRDSIGLDNTSTNGNFVFASYSAGGNPTLVTLKVAASEAVTLKNLRIVASQLPGTTREWPWTTVDYQVNVWADWNAVLVDHYRGNLVSELRDEPDPGAYEFGTSVDWGGSSPAYPTYSMEFDLTPYAIDLSPGEERWLGVTFVLSGVPIGIVESTEAGESDRLVFGPVGGASWINIVDDQSGEPRSTHFGRMAFRVTAMPLVTLTGDLDVDRDVDLMDFDLFADCMAGPGLPGACDPVVAARADIDVDGDVDMIDFSQFQLHFGESCP